MAACQHSVDIPWVGKLTVANKQAVNSGTLFATMEVGSGGIPFGRSLMSA